MTRSLRRQRAWYLAAAVLIACGGSSATRGGKKGTPGTGGTAGSGQSGTAGTTEPGGGEGGADDGARGGSSPTGGKAGRGGTMGTGGSARGGSSTGGRGGQAGGIGGAAGSGGSSGAGGSSGSSGAGGSGGGLPLPDGCEARSSTEVATHCTLSGFCDGTPNIADCNDAGSGFWRCSCSLEHNDRLFEIKGAPGLASCAVALGLCSEDELELGAETCSARRDDKDENACAFELACGKPITQSFAPGVDASLVEYGEGECVRDQWPHPFECQCDTRDTFSQYGLLAESGEDACRPLVDFCMSGREPAFEGPAECFDTAVTLESGYCSLDQICATSMRLTDDVRLASLEPRSASCETYPSGTHCYCSDQGSVFPFGVAALPVQETCTLAMANCDEDPDIRVIGEPDCHPSSQFAGADSCDADLDCTQEATVNSRAIVANGRLLVRCARVEPGQPWRCSCASNQDTTTFVLGSASSTSWEACGLAPAACLERMSVYVGPYGDLVSPPDPLAGQ